MGFPYLTSEVSSGGISRHLALSRVMNFEQQMHRRLGDSRPVRYLRMYNYYTGMNLPPENVDQPLNINLFKPIVDKHASYFWGQWRERLVTFRVRPRWAEDLSVTERAQADAYGRIIRRFLEYIYDQSKGNKLFWQASKNGGLFGDTILHARYDPRMRRVVWQNIHPEFFHCMWDVNDMNTLRDVVIAYPIDRVQAKEMYGVSGNDKMLGYSTINAEYAPGIGTYWQHWSEVSVQQWVDDERFRNTPNPYMTQDNQGNLYPGMLPFVHIPNMPAGADFWGFSDSEAVIYLIDEINRRVADIGDMVNAQAHSIILIKNFSARLSELQVGPSEMWDMGKDGEAERLEGVGPDAQVIAYIDKLLGFIQATANMPEAAFGASKSGTTHQSGVVQAQQLMPVVERAREKRIQWKEGIKDLIEMTFRIYDILDPAVLQEWGLSWSDIQKYEIEPVWADVLPKDELQKVNEEVATYVNGLRSLERSLEHLGEEDPAAEAVRIWQDMAKKAMMGQQVPPPTGPAGKNSEDGVGGSAALPGGIGAKQGQPGTLIKSPDLDASDNASLSNA